MAPPHPAPDLYSPRLEELRVLRAALDARLTWIAPFRVLAPLGSAGTALSATFRPLPEIGWVGVGGLAAIFLGALVAHAVLVTRLGRVDLRIRLAERGQKRIAGDLAGLPEQGERFVSAAHPYAADLDLFGRASLFQLVSVVETGIGERTLAGWLLAPTGAEEVAARQEAVRELAPLLSFREDLAVAGVEAGVQGRDPDLLFRFAEGGDTATSGGESAGAWRLRAAAGGVLVLLTAGMLVAGRVLGSGNPLLRNLFWLPLLAQTLFLTGLRARTEPLLSAASSREESFGRYVGLLRHLEGADVTAPRLRALRGTLAGASGSDASRAIGSLQRIVGFAELRQNAMVHFLVNVVLLWDLWCGLALLRWRERWGGRVRAWLTAVGELEALASLATFAGEHPDHAWPEVAGGPARFEAQGLGHPLIKPGSRVANDVDLPDPEAALLITGSNMSGKSTLLRSMGINAVLALAGAPVCAARLQMTPLAVRTSIRIKDSLEEGVSHFYAELKRLKEIVDTADGGTTVLFLLDEILHGTNSRERRIGAEAVVLHLLDRGAMGAVSSHDLGLAELERQSGGRVRNVHFEESVADGRMTFDYRLKPGVVTTSNALRLMKQVGLSVELPE
jgi:MutS domain V